MKALYVFATILLVASLCVVGAQAQLTKCSDYNGTPHASRATNSVYVSGNVDHSGGLHGVANNSGYSQSCNYTGGGPYNPQDGEWWCIGHGVTTAVCNGFETGTGLPSGKIHCVNGGCANGGTSVAGPSQASSWAHGAYAVSEVPSAAGCTGNTPTISINAFGHTATPNGGYAILEQADTDGPLWLCDANESTSGTPLVVGWGNDNFTNSFTGVQSGQQIAWVDPTDPNDYRQTTWTKKNANVAWLVIPDASGHVTDIKHNFFSSISPQVRRTDGKYAMPSGFQAPNGVEAAAWYDRPENGGNNNGQLDPGDAVWSQIRVWWNTAGDAQYDQINKPTEVLTLADLGINSCVITDYTAGNLTDGHGNKKAWVLNCDITPNPAYPNLQVYDVQFGDGSQQ